MSCTGRSKVEGFKEQSRQLRGHLAQDFGPADGRPDVGDDSKQLLKFHGLYQQDDRDRRAARKREGQDAAYSFMVRSRIPGGRMTAQQYLVHDDLAQSHGNGTLRITTRQDLQLHGVLKGDVRGTLQAIDAALLTTFGACGDCVRNVMFCPAPGAGVLRALVEADAHALADRLRLRGRAYHELWLDGEPAGGGEPEEPVYGDAYLPRKFKIAVALPGDNCVDVYTQDVGAVPIVEGEDLAGYNVLAGGGLGMTHTKPNTFPRLGDAVAFVRPHELGDIVEHIVCVHRDHGDRADRRHARLKYLVHDRGLDWLRAELERRSGHRLDAPRPMPPLELRLHLGWRLTPEGTLALGLSVENGRVRDEGTLHLRTALRTLVRRYEPQVLLTPHQNVILSGLPPAERREIEALLVAHGVPAAAALSAVRLHSMACPALPTCGLALAEAERALPAVIDELEATLREIGLGAEPITVRMTGCPNGCARPYVAEIGIVGRSLDRYALFLGGRRDGSRLNQPYADLVPASAVVATVRPLLLAFRGERRPGESFGDFCQRLGLDALRARAARGPEDPATEVRAHA